MICALCGETFTGRSRKYCHRTRHSCHVVCGDFFTWTCRKRIVKTCSPRCASLNRVKTLCCCVRCGKRFESAGHREYCQERKIKTCIRCGRKYDRLCGPNAPKTECCDSICWNLNDDFDASKLEEYRSIDVWALDFARECSRKPHVADVRQYFRVRNLPTHADPKLFDGLPKGSFLEQRVVDAIMELDSSLVIERNTRPLWDGQRRLEIDILIPELNIGIEVQDFSTHDREHNVAIGRFGVKHGPEYHALKKRLAHERRITLFELWEDEVLSSSLKVRLAELLASARVLT